jgi:methyl-accepting chemotaxis protein
MWNQGDEEPTQDAIFQELSKREHVRETLIPSIRSNGGLLEPVLVRKNVVLEGNNRLAAYRVLATAPDRKQWEQIRVRILPDSISDSDVFSLLGEYHIVGKKSWQPFEQAGYLFRRFKTQGVSEDELRQELGVSKLKVSQLIRVYQYMMDHGERNPERWSYFDELLKARKFEQTRKLYPNFDEFITEKIQSGEIARAVDVREQLAEITRVGGNTLKKFMSGAYSFEEAAKDAQLRGSGNHNIKRISEFRKWLADQDLDEELEVTSKEELKVVKFEFEKIQARLSKLMKKVAP